MVKMIALKYLLVGLTVFLSLLDRYDMRQYKRIYLNETIHWHINSISTKLSHRTDKKINMNFTESLFTMRDRTAVLLNDRVDYDFEDNQAITSMTNGNEKRTYDDEFKYMKEIFDHYGGLKDRSYATLNLTCNLQPFRAYDTLILANYTQHIGISDPVICLFRTNSTQGLERSFLRERTGTWNISQYSLADKKGDFRKYKTSGVVALYGTDPESYTAVVFDESFGIKYWIMNDVDSALANVLEEESRKHLRTIVDLSRVDLDDKNRNFPAYNHLKTLGLDNYVRHFDYSYIESITYVDGTLCFTSGIRRFRGPRVTCWRSNKNNTTGPAESGAAILEDFENQIDQQEIIIDEFEITHDQEAKMYHYHALTYKTAAKGQPLTRDLMVQYWHCSMAERPAFLATQQAGCGPLEPVDRSPLAMVTYENPSGSCRRLVVFYTQLVQLYDIGQKITDRPKATMLADWMRFQVNAAFYLKGRFYFFAGGNSVWTMLAMDDSDCVDIFDRSTLQEFRASEVLWQFRNDYVNSSDPPRGPVFTGYSSYEDGKLTDNVELKGVSADYKIDVEKFAKLRTTSSGGVTGNGGDSSMSWLLIAVLVVPLPLVTFALVYYFCMRPQKKPIQVQLGPVGSGVKAGGSGVGGRAGSPMSELEQARTIRSSLDAIRSKSPGSPQQSAKMSSKIMSRPKSRVSKGPKSAKSAKSPHQKSRSPKSKSVVKSIKTSKI